MMLLQSSALPSTTGHPVQLLKKGFHEEDIWCTLGASCPRETLWELVDHNFVSRLRFSIKKGKKRKEKESLSEVLRSSGFLPTSHRLGQTC